MSNAAVPYLCSERLAVKVQPNSPPGSIEWLVHHIRSIRIDRDVLMYRLVHQTFHAPKTLLVLPRTEKSADRCGRGLSVMQRSSNER